MQKIYILFLILIGWNSYSQKIIKIKSADIVTKDEENFPGATIGLGNVFVEMDGGTLQCQKAILYSEDNFLEAVGNIV